MRSLKLSTVAFLFCCIIGLAPFIWSTDLAANNRIKLPDIGNTSSAVISAQLEKKLGKAFIRSVRRRVPLSGDQEINDYIQKIGNKIAKSSEQPDRHFNFFVVNDQRINAFAGPDGHIGINAGLILTTESESELASVIAHEVGHVTQQHLKRAIETASQMAVPNAAATLAAVALGIALGPAALIAVQAAQVQKQINFTRRHEAEADRVGVQNLADAGFDPRSMPIFFGRLQKASRYYGQKLPEILRTHPAPISRVSDTAARAEKYPYKQVVDSQDFRLVRMRLRVKSKKVSPFDLIKALETESAQGIKGIKAAASYGLALAYSADHQYAKARQTLTRLTLLYPQQYQYQTALALNEHADGKIQTAFSILKTAKHRFPQSRAVNLKFSKFLLHTGQPKQALTFLNKDLQEYPPTPEIYDLLSIAYGQTKKPVRGYQYRAEYLYAYGLTKDAIVQLEQALLAAGENFYQSSQIENRIDQLKKELDAPALL
ncbi:MAG: peptidase M48 [Cycloclasticus sp. symbiont of Poecilosclerida sp. M]|nr:MAG: peptidase M48 [Cycloclasticus sp. symbiont of Poecilosclerida sp. M]